VEVVAFIHPGRRRHPIGWRVRRNFLEHRVTRGKPGPRWIARNLSVALLAGAWTPRALRRVTEERLGPVTVEAQRRLIHSLTRKFAVGKTVPPSPDALRDFLLKSGIFDEAIERVLLHAYDSPAVLTPPRFAPSARCAGLGVPEIVTLGHLADWLGVTVAQLDWLADGNRQHERTRWAALQHYRYTFIPKASGPPRLIEAPKGRLKILQRRILRHMLDPLPPADCAHGFIARRSVLTAARVHAGEAVVVTVDLKDFFTATRLSRVHAIFRALGYPWSVARALTGLCSTSTPESVFQRLAPGRRPDWAARRMFRERHLAQGAPTSPALANLAARSLDARLTGLAQAYGARYTRYADDLAFSGDEAFADRIDSFLRAIDEITRDEGYALNTKKTRIMRASACQRITGVVVNSHVNVARTEFDRLKATLHNCVKTGPEPQNLDRLPDFRAHLEGRVNWVENVNFARGRKLRLLFDRIAW
jgi:RNA-directed DNA polymerase